MHYFNPHSRKGSDGKYIDDIPEFIISIHTPARGVTTEILSWNYILRISIHTPARGVTLVPRRLKHISMISIHTPARGVTYQGHI